MTDKDFSNINPIVYDAVEVLLVITTPNGTAPTTVEVKKNVSTWFSASQKAVEFTKHILLAKSAECALCMTGVTMATANKSSWKATVQLLHTRSARWEFFS